MLIAVVVQPCIEISFFELVRDDINRLNILFAPFDFIGVDQHHLIR